MSFFLRDDPLTRIPGKSGYKLKKRKVSQDLAFIVSQDLCKLHFKSKF